MKWNQANLGNGFSTQQLYLMWYNILYEHQIISAAKCNFFQTPSGHQPVRDWLKEMNSADRRLIGEDIKLVQYRWPLGMPLVRKMDTELWEVRSKLENRNIARVFFTVSEHQIILLHGIIKKSPKTPKNELDLAVTRKKQWKQGE